MAKSSTLNIRVDPETKANAEKLFSKFGITISEAVNIFLHQSLMVGGLPFDVRMSEPNAATIAAIKEIEDMISGKINTAPQKVTDLFDEMDIDERG